jgi:hypothetical protein
VVAKTERKKRPLPSRAEQVATLQAGHTYDILIVGGGATGAGCALDATTRGKFKIFDIHTRYKQNNPSKDRHYSKCNYLWHHYINITMLPSDL